MAFNIATTCMKDDPDRSPSDVVRLKLHLDKQRLIMHEGMQLCRFVIFSDYDKQDFIDAAGGWYEDENANSPYMIMPVEGCDDLPHPSFAIRHVFKNTRFGEKDKTMYIDCKVIPRGVSHSILFSSLPDRGEPEHTSYPIADEDAQAIRDNNWATLNFPVDWTDTEETTIMPYFFQHNYGEHDELVAKMHDNSVISKYKTFAHFIEGEYDEFMLPFQPAVIGKYFANNKEKNLALNESYEKNVRPSFPEQWRGTGGDEEAEYISYDHDWRDITRQTSMLYIDETDGPMSDDYYLSLWIL